MNKLLCQRHLISGPQGPPLAYWSTKVFKTTPSPETRGARCLFVIFPASQGQAAVARFFPSPPPPPPSSRSWRSLTRPSPRRPWVWEVWRQRGRGIASHAHPATYLPGDVAPATTEIMVGILLTRVSSSLKMLHSALFRHDREDSSSLRQTPSPPTPRSTPCANPRPSVPALAHTACHQLQGWYHLQQGLLHQIPVYGGKECKTT